MCVFSTVRVRGSEKSGELVPALRWKTGNRRKCKALFYSQTKPLKWLQCMEVVSRSKFQRTTFVLKFLLISGTVEISNHHRTLSRIRMQGHAF